MDSNPFFLLSRILFLLGWLEGISSLETTTTSTCRFLFHWLSFFVLFGWRWKVIFLDCVILVFSDFGGTSEADLQQANISPSSCPNVSDLCCDCVGDCHVAVSSWPQHAAAFSASLHAISLQWQWEVEWPEKLDLAQSVIHKRLLHHLQFLFFQKFNGSRTVNVTLHSEKKKKLFISYGKKKLNKGRYVLNS